MDAANVEILKQILQLGLAGVMTTIASILWLAYQSRTKEYIEVLKEVAGLKVTLSARRSNGNGNGNGNGSSGEKLLTT